MDVNKSTQPLGRIGNLPRAATDVSDPFCDVISKDVMVIRCSEFEHRTNNNDRLFRDITYTKLRSEWRQRNLLQNRRYTSSATCYSSQERTIEIKQKQNISRKCNVTVNDQSCSSCKKKQPAIDNCWKMKCGFGVRIYSFFLRMC